MENTISITSIRLRSVWMFFKLSWLGLKIMRHARVTPGFVHFSNTGFGYMHYTLSVWESEEAMRKFAFAEGVHKSAMLESRRLATEIKTFTYHSTEIPNWKAAKQLVGKNGKVLRF